MMACFAESRQVARRGRYQQPHSSPGEPQSDDAADEREQHALREEASGDANTARTKSHANGNLAPTCFGAHQEHIGDVRTRDQEHEAYRSKQDPESTGDVADGRVLDRPRAREQLDLCRVSRSEAIARICLWHICNQAVQLRARVRNRRSVAQPRYPVVLPYSKTHRPRDWLGHPYVDAWIRKRTRRRHDADDLRRHTRQHHRPAEDASVAAKST